MEMKELDNSTITVKTAALVMGALLTLTTTVVTVYFTAINAVEKGFEKFNLELVEQKNEVKILRLEMDNLRNQVDINTATIKAITNYISPDNYVNTHSKNSSK